MREGAHPQKCKNRNKREERRFKSETNKRRRLYILAPKRRVRGTDLPRKVHSWGILNARGFICCNLHHLDARLGRRMRQLVRCVLCPRHGAKGDLMLLGTIFWNRIKFRSECKRCFEQKLKRGRKSSVTFNLGQSCPASVIACLKKRTEKKIRAEQEFL